jgi:nicotinamidase-related amidase
MRRARTPVLHLLEDLRFTYLKNILNCFTRAGVGAMLLEKNVRRVAITGIQMEQRCETTALCWCISRTREVG